MPSIRPSLIVNAYVVDRQGANPKDRYNLVVRVDGSVCFALAITASVDIDNLGEYQIAMPYSAIGNCKTGLSKPCAV